MTSNSHRLNQGLRLLERLSSIAYRRSHRQLDPRTLPVHLQRDLGFRDDHLTPRAF